MIKKIVIFALALAALLAFSACLSEADETASEDQPTGEVERVTMRAEIIEIGEKITVNVIEGQYGASGIYLVITSPDTVMQGSEGEALTRDGLSAGMTVEIIYGGQVMMSIPPQIVAKSITVIQASES